MQLLSKSDVFAENKLFATVDSTVRKVVLHGIPFLLTDTVGFIRKLPHALIECFKSTLDEVREADILIHVVDISHPSFEEQKKIVHTTLADIGAADKPTITVYNKIDLWQEQHEAEEAERLNGYAYLDTGQMPLPEATYLNEGEETVFISAAKKQNIEALREVLYQKVADKFYTIYPNYQKNTVY
jgi:GTP-binding protein HflX